ncbi:MAG: amidohydrolase family protein [Verrucomicrobiota bacterium]|nr:amidohydrolase family protein [Verrucomicrobiota bacterium]
MNAELRTELRKRLNYLSTPRDWVVDADCHLTDTTNLSGPILEKYRSQNNYYHGRPINAAELIAEMDMAAVDLALIWQNPAATPVTGDMDANTAALLAANRAIADSANRYDTRLLPAGWTDPRNCGLEGAMHVVEVCVRELGFPVVKLNPAQNAYPLDSDPVIAVVDHILKLGAIPAFHFGADTGYTPASALARVARHCGSQRVVAVHMGGGGASYPDQEALCQEARLLGLELPNIFYIQSAKRDTHCESDFITYTLHGAPAVNNIAIGSDAPYGRMSWNFGGYRALFASLRDPRHPDERLRGRAEIFTRAERGFMGNNVVKLYTSALENLLKTS